MGSTSIVGIPLKHPLDKGLLTQQKLSDIIQEQEMVVAEIAKITAN